MLYKVFQDKICRQLDSVIQTNSVWWMAKGAVPV